MRLLITGASGYLGWHLARHATRAGHVTLGTHLTHQTDTAAGPTLKLDFRRRADCDRVAGDFAPDAILHAGAMTSTAICEMYPEEATETNVAATQNLLAAAAKLAHAPHFVFLSTDLVFDGERGSYAEDDSPAPLMHYGRTKVEAERAVMEYGGPWTIARSALIYGPPGTGERRCFLDWMLEGMRSGEVTLFNDEFRSPVHVDDLCMALLRIVHTGAKGLFHLGGGERLSRADFGLLAADAFGLDQRVVRVICSADLNLAPPRPRDVSMSVAKAQRDLGYEPADVRAGLLRVVGD